MILILGGTSDSILLAKGLFEITESIILSTATEYGKMIADSSFKGRTIYGKMDQETLEEFCLGNQIKTIIDATHPYAQVISENAIYVSSKLHLNYMRYERAASVDNQEAYKDVLACEDYEDAGRIANEREGNVFIATGSRQIERILQGIKDKSRAYVRVLPQSEQLLKLEALGLNPNQIIAMKGPFSYEMNLLLLKETKARMLITKDSGAAGKTEEKLKAARQLGVQIIIIKRPKLLYPKVFYSMNEIVNNLKR